MDEVSLNTEPIGDDDTDDFEVVGDCAMTEYVGQTGIIQNPLPPAVGMEFEMYDDVYYFYNCYAKEQGFGVRVSNTWLMETKRWRIIEVELEHNHLLSPRSGKFCKSHKHIDVNGVFGNNVNSSNQLKLKPGDAQAVQSFFCRLQLTDPNFFNVVDLNEKGCLRNLFWTDTRSRVAYRYFGDVVLIDTTCLIERYDVPLVSFIGVNHYGQSVLLGCGLLASETIESYTWLFRAWLTCMLGRSPQTIITDQCRILQIAVGDVFPRAYRCFSLSCIMQKIPVKLQGLFEYEAIKAALHRAIYHSLRPEKFEAAWKDMIQRHGIKDHGWIQTLYEDRKRWAPIYLKEAFLSGVFSFPQNEVSTSYFEGYLDKNTPLKEFLDKYDQALRANYQLEALADMDSRNSSCIQKPRCYYEFQLSKLYTNEMLRKFQTEVEAMYSCYSTKHVSADGPITYIVKEEFEVGSNEKDSRAFDVLYNASNLEVLCVCGLFNFRGYLCRHILCVLNQSGVQEIPSQYILSRWRKDVKRSYFLNHSCSGVDIKNPVHRYDDLYKRIVQVVEEGRQSQDRYKVTLQALDKILNKLHLVEDHQVWIRCQSPPNKIGEEAASKLYSSNAFPYFETKGYKSAVIQDVPILKPLSRAQVLELQTALDMAQDHTRVCFSIQIITSSSTTPNYASVPPILTVSFPSTPSSAPTPSIVGPLELPPCTAPSSLPVTSPQQSSQPISTSTQSTSSLPVQSSSQTPLDRCPTNHHDMTTGAKNNIHKPLQKLNLCAHFSPPSDCEPTTVTQAIKNPHWRQSMSEEYDALVLNGTWKLVPPPILSNIVGCKWIFVLKDIPTVLLTGSKLVLLPKGSINGLVWTIMTLSVQLLSPPQYGLFLVLMLVMAGLFVNWISINAFLQGQLSEDVYMAQPPCFIDSDHPKYVCAEFSTKIFLIHQSLLRLTFAVLPQSSKIIFKLAYICCFAESAI
ncbi:protein FAR1-RELATED SEQUENCE 6 [Citrus sinensis]|nr:protein FAR1-RELATED SEQUENCE 6 [Citrus sinensis]